jgi:uncharacterized DUF497 family protein
MKFEWNTQKEQNYILKHGVTFEQASYAFTDPFALNIFDTEHSENEERWAMLRMSLNQVILVVAHTFRNTENIELARIMSAIKATNRELETYQNRC